MGKEKNGRKNFLPKLPPADNPEQWRQIRRDIREKWLLYLGGLPEHIAAEKPQVVSEEKKGGLVRQKIRYATGGSFYSEAYVIRPALLRRRMPSAVVFHSTVNSNIDEPAGLDSSIPSSRYTAVHLARRGYVTISPHCFIYDNTFTPVPPGMNAWEKAVSELHRHHPGWRGMTKMLSDGMRAVDILEGYTFVDRSRIGCIGFSLGAKESLYLAAFDERIKACVCNEPGIGINFSNWDAPWYLGTDIRKDMDNHQIIALIAPRAFLLVCGESEDGERSLPYIEAAKPVYRALGVEDSLKVLRHKKGHICVPAINTKVYRWLDSRLGDI